MRPSDQRNHNDYKNCPSYNHKANGYTGLVSIVIKASFSYTSAYFLMKWSVYVSI